MRKLLSTALALGVFASTGLAPAAFADVALNALPNLNSADKAIVTTPGAGQMNIKIDAGQGGVGTLNWNSYNIGKDATVNYEFSAHNQTALNKVSSAGGLSQIYGKITNSGCANCGYEGTGKIILLNPNGVLFGDGANVNVNSFTVSNMEGTFDKTNNKLNLVRNPQAKYGIMVQGGAKIYGDKNVTFAADDVYLYSGSKISTNVGNNVGDTAYGKVKIVTSDGVNFSYYNNGAISGLDGLKVSGDKMQVIASGDITSGHIDVRNYSSNADSQINLNGATLKATKAVKGNDGNIWLTALGKVVVDKSSLTTVNGGNVKLTSNAKNSVKNSTITSSGKVDIISQVADAVIENSVVKAAKDLTVNAAKIASVQKGATVNGKNVTIQGETAQVYKSAVTADENVNLISSGDMVWTEESTITAGKEANATASNGYLLLNKSTFTANDNVNLTSKDDISSAKLDGTTFTSGKNVNVESTAGNILLTSTSQFKPTGTLNLKANKNVEINATGDLTTQKTNITAGDNVFLTSKEGNVTVKDSTKFLAADKIIIRGAKNVKTSGTVDLNNIKTQIEAGQEVNATLANVGNKDNGLVAKAGTNMTITTNGTLSVSSLISGKDMTINANKVIAGKEYTSKDNHLDVDKTSNRSYIEVGGEFTSNVKTDNYVVTDSGDLTDDGQYNQRHHIQYGDEKIVLVNKRPVDNNVTDPNLPGIGDGDEADPIKPGQTPDDPNPSDPGQGGEDPGQGGEDPGQGGEDPGQGGNGDEDCEDTPNSDDLIEEEDPELPVAGTISTYAKAINNVANYSAQTKEQK